MGSFKNASWEYEWVPREFFLFVKEKTGCEIFIETGTGSGKTSLWAADHFKNVYTIEASKENYDESQKVLNKKNNVKMYFGKSLDFLSMLSQELKNKTCIFWLDAHWTHRVDLPFYGRYETHPLLKEISIIKARLGVNYIFIDDMRFITYSFTPPGGTQIWPSIKDICFTLYDYEIAIYGDVMLASLSKNILIDWKKKIKGTELDIL